MEKQQHYRQNGTQLNHHLEHFVKFLAYLELYQLVQKNHMSCGGDGKPLRNALHNAKENSLQKL